MITNRRSRQAVTSCPEPAFGIADESRDEDARIDNRANQARLQKLRFSCPAAPVEDTNYGGGGQTVPTGRGPGVASMTTGAATAERGVSASSGEPTGASVTHDNSGGPSGSMVYA